MSSLLHHRPSIRSASGVPVQPLFGTDPLPPEGSPQSDSSSEVPVESVVHDRRSIDSYREAPSKPAEMGSISRFLDGLRDPNLVEESSRKLFERCYQRLVTLAGSRLKGRIRPNEINGSEDIAQEVFFGLCEKLREGDYPNLKNRQALWKLLSVITLRRAFREARYHSSMGRPGRTLINQCDGDISDSGNTSIGGLLANLADHREDDLENRIIAEHYNHMIARLQKPELRQVAELRLLQLSRSEIAQRLGIDRKTVQRRLEMIFNIWVREDIDLEPQ